MLKPKNPLSRTNIPLAEPPFSFKLRGRLVPAQSRLTLPSSLRPRLPSADKCPLGKLTSRANQGRNKKIPPRVDADSQVRPRRRTAGAVPDAISTGLHCRRALHAHRAPSSSSSGWRITRKASIFVQTGAWGRPSCQELVVRPLPDRQPPFARPT